MSDEKEIVNADEYAAMRQELMVMRQALCDLRFWLRYWAPRTISQQSQDRDGRVTNSWAACPIPDWDVKQKLQAIDEALTTDIAAELSKQEGDNG
jgi:hypothetical protein